MLHMAVARPSSDGNMLCTSGFVDDLSSRITQGIGQNWRRRVCFV